MKEKNNNPISASRRKWFLSAGRWSVLGLSVLGFGGLWKRNGISTYRETCVDKIGKIGCRRCAYLNECGHPKALSAKRIILKIKNQK